MNDANIKLLAKEINYHLVQLQHFISHELAQAYIRENKVANHRLRWLSNWISQF